jgi:hypothetical protein
MGSMPNIVEVSGRGTANVETTHAAAQGSAAERQPSNGAKVERLEFGTRTCCANNGAFLVLS